MKMHAGVGESNSPDAHELAIIGCGMVGLVAALVLANAGVRVLLVGRKPSTFTSTASEPFDPRVFALSHRSQRLLAQLRVWDNIPPDQLQPVRGMHVWGDANQGNTQGELLFSASESGVEALTWIVEQRSLLQVLCAAAQFQSGIRWEQSNAEHFERTAGGWNIHTAEQVIHAPLLLAADGANSKTRAAAGLDFDRVPYGCDGVVATFEAENPHHGIARQWFDNGAILALLPLSGRHVSMVWSMPHHQTQHFLQQPPEQQACLVEQAAQGAVHEHYGQLRPRGPVHAFPLRHGLAPVWFHEQVVLMGDAAHVVHPLSGQGLNLGLEDLVELANCLRTMRPSKAMWQTWARRRKAGCLPMHWLTQGLHGLFRLQLPGAAVVRNQGMRWINQVPMLKRWLSQQAMR